MYAAIESDGELYKMQQEAIRRARETARRSMDYGAGPSRPDSAPAPQYISDPQPQHAPAPEHMPPGRRGVRAAAAKTQRTVTPSRLYRPGRPWTIC